MKKYTFNYGQNSIGENYLNKVTEYGSDENNLNSTVIDYVTVQSPDGRSDLLGFDYRFGAASLPSNSSQFGIGFHGLTV